MEFNRRQLIHSLFAGSALFPAMISELLASTQDPLAPRTSHFPGKAKRVIFLFMTGGVSHVDSFDPKPALTKAAADGKKGMKDVPFMGSPWGFKQYGQSGVAVGDLFPHMGGIVDDLCVIRSMTGDHNDHFQATMGVHTGSVTVKRPSIGSWVSYGMGTENRNLPSFVVLAPHLPYAGAQVWSSDFLPGAHSGTRISGGAEPIADLQRRAPTAKSQELELDLLAKFNKLHQQSRGSDPALAARIKSFEIAYGMQSDMPEVFDFSKESQATLALYGLKPGQTSGFGWQCLVARRMAERGVRFIELIDTGSNHNWDFHSNLTGMTKLAESIDQPVAGLIKDLKARGMLDDTLVVWTTEFGRTPWGSPESKGREHYNKVYSSWLAGGGIKPGVVYGSSDEYGVDIAENEVHVHDFNATILHCLGFDHTRLTYRHAGRDFRLTDVHGNVVKSILA
ncbi:MAG: DUF1501 domain-containing protein [Bryobacteraceae bacterium]|nr:DUF1501 domain-containing protein [Bryobacteraceae bacterium]